MRRLALPALLLGLAAGAARGAADLADLVAELADPRIAVRVEAVEELARRRDPAALPALIRTLFDDPVPDLRQRAAYALRAIGDERAVPFLARVLAAPDPALRAEAVLGMGELGGAYVLPAVTPLLADPERAVRAAAIHALGEVGDPLSLDHVLEVQAAAATDPEPAIHGAAILAAARIGGPAGLARALEIAGTRPVASWVLRAVVARAIGEAGDRARIPWLVERFSADEEPRVMQAAAGALGALGAMEQLLAGARHEVVFRRRAAVAALAASPGEAALPALRSAAGDADPGIRLEAAAALLERGEAGAFVVLIRLLEAEAPTWLGAMKALEDATGETFGRDPPRWTAWLERAGDRLRFHAGTKTWRAAGR